MPISSDGSRWRHNMTMYSNPPVLTSSILALLFILCSTIPVVAALDGLDGLYGAPLSIDICTRSQNYRQSIHLPCTVAKTSNFVIKWLKDGDKLDFTNFQGAGLREGGTLELFEPEKMLGLYQCVATQQDGRVVMSNVTRVYSTEFTIPSTRRITTIRQVDEGKPVMLKCLNEADIVYNEGSYTCVWRVNNKEIDLTNSEKYQQATDGSLIILYSEESDSGEYTCDLTYSNCYGNKESITRLKYSLNVQSSTAVFNPEQPLHADNTPTPYTVVEGQPFTLQCVFGGRRNGATASISWYDPAHQIISQGSNQVTISRASKTEHEGKFRCEGKFPGSALSSAIEIDVKVEEPPKISGPLQDLTVPVNETVILRCPATGRPEPETSWFINGSAVLSASSSALVDQTEGILTLLRVEFMTSVSCEVSNKHGHQVSNALITTGSAIHKDPAVKVSSTLSSSSSSSSTTATTTTTTTPTPTTTTSPAPSASLSFNPVYSHFSSKTDLPSDAKLPTSILPTSPSLKQSTSSSSSSPSSSSTQEPMIKPDPPRTPGLPSPSTGSSSGGSTLTDGPLREKEPQESSTGQSGHTMLIIVGVVVGVIFIVVVLVAVGVVCWCLGSSRLSYGVSEDRKRKRAELTGFLTTEDNGRSQAADHAPQRPIYRQPQVNVVTPIRTIITTEDELNNYKQNDLNEKKQLNVESMTFKFNDFGQNLNFGPQKDKLSYSHSF